LSRRGATCSFYCDYMLIPAIEAIAQGGYKLKNQRKAAVEAKAERSWRSTHGDRHGTKPEVYGGHRAPGAEADTAEAYLGYSLSGCSGLPTLTIWRYSPWYR
jgi:hypothetical protein